MAGASGSGAIGLCYQSSPKEEQYTLVTCHATGLFRVCVKLSRKPGQRQRLKEVIAEFQREKHAQFLVDALRRGDV